MRHKLETLYMIGCMEYSMKLYVSKLSIGYGKSPLSPKIYVRPCKYYGTGDENEIIEGVGADEIIDYVDEGEIIDDDDDFSIMDYLINEFRNGKLRQGWGSKYGEYSMDLHEHIYDENGKLQPTKKWVCDFMNIRDATQEEAIGRFKIISRLLDMEREDVVFVPNIPSDDMFSVATVDGDYVFSPIKDYGHGHIIHVKNVKEYHYGDDTLPKKLWSFPPAVVRIRKDEKFKTFLNKLYF